jgi:hypothetical protein
MSRTIKGAVVKRCHDELPLHLQLFADASNAGRRLKTLRGLTPDEFICRTWTKEPERFRFNPSHPTPGPNTDFSTPGQSPKITLRKRASATVK